MANDLRILITGQLNLKQTASEINKQLKNIRVDNLNLKVNVDTKTLKEISTSLNNTQKKNQQDYVKWWATVLEKQESKRERVLQAEHKTRVSLEKKLASERENVLKEEQNIRKKIEDQRIQEEQNIAKKRENALREEQKIRRAISVRQLNEQIKQQQNAFNLDLFKEQSSIKTQNLITAYGKNIDSKALQDYQNAVNRLTSSTPRLNQEIQKLNTSFKQIEADARLAANSLSGSFDNALSKIIQWGAATTAVYGTINAMQALIQTTIELDDQMTQLRRVMDEDTNFNGLMEGSIELSRELGQTLTNTNASLIEFARAGQSSADALANARAVLLAMNVSELSAADATKTVIVGRQVFNDELKDSIDLINRLNQVDNDFSTTTQDLALSLIKAGSTAKTFGADLNTLLGYTVSIQAATQESGNVVGNSLKTILSRITTVSGSVSALNEVGISVRDMAGNMKPVSEVLTELAAKWNTLSSEQQQNIALQAAGRYQLNRFLALMQNMDVAVKATESAVNSQGSAIRENEKAMESLTYQLNALQGSWQELVYVISEAGLKTGLSTIIQAITGLIQGFTEFTRMTNGLNIALPTLTLTLYGVSQAFIAISSAARTADLSIKGFKASLGLFGIALVGIELLISAFISTSDAISQSTDEIQRYAEKTQETSSRLGSLVERYEELRNSAQDNTEAQKELQDVMNEIQSIQPALVQSTDAYGNALEINTGKAKNYAETLKAMSIEQATLAKATLQAQNANLEIDISEARKSLKEIQEEYQVTYDQIKQFQEKYNVEAIEDARQIVKVRQNELDYLKQIGNDSLYRQRRVELNDYINELKTYEINMKSIASTEYFEARNSLQALLDRKNANDDIIKGLDEQFFGATKTKDAQDSLNNSLQQGVTIADEFGDAVDNVTTQEEKFIAQFEKTQDSVSELNLLLNDLAQGKAITADRAFELTQKEKGLIDAITVENGIIEINEDAVRALRDSKIDAFNDMIQANIQEVESEKQRLAAVLESYGIQASAIQNLAQLRLELARVESESEFRKSGFVGVSPEVIQASEDVQKFAGLIEQLNSLKKESQLASAALRTAGLDSPSGSQSKSEYEALTEDAKALIQAENELAQIRERQKEWVTYSEQYQQELDKERQQLEKIIALKEKELKTTESKGGSAKESDEAFKKAEDLRKEIAQLQNELDEVATKQENSILEKYTKNIQDLDKVLQANEESIKRLDTASQGYRDGLDQDISLLESKRTMYQDEINYLSNLATQYGASTAKGAQYRDRLQEISTALISVNNAIDDKKAAKFDSVMEQNQNTIEKLNHQLEVSRNKFSNLEEGGSAWNAELQKQTDLTKMQKSLTQVMIGQLTAEMNTLQKGTAAYKSRESQLRSLQSALMGYNNTLRENFALEVQAADRKFEQSVQREIDNVSKLRNQIVDQLTKLQDQLSADTFNFDSVENAFENTLQKINNLKGNYDLSGILDTAFNVEDVEKNTKKYLEQLEEINEEVESFLDTGYISQRDFAEIFEKEVEYAVDLKTAITNINQLLEERKRQHEQIQKYLENEISLIEKERDAIIDQLQDSMEVPVQIDWEQVKDDLVALGQTGKITIGDVTLDLDNATVIGDVPSDTHSITQNIISDYSNIVELNNEIQKQNELFGKQEEIRKKILELESKNKKETKEYKELVEELNDITKEVASSREKIRETIEKEIESLNELREEERKINEEIQERETLFKRQQEQINKQIESAQKLYDEQIAKEQEKLDLLDEQIEREDRLIERQKLLQELEDARNDKRFEYINADGEVELTYDKGRVKELEEQLADFDRETQRDEQRKEIEDNIDRLEKARDKEIERLEKYLSDLEETHNKEIEQLNFYLNQNRALQELLNSNIERHIADLEETYNDEIDFFNIRLDELKLVHEAEIAAMEAYKEGLEHQLERINEDIGEKIDYISESMQGSIDNLNEVLDGTRILFGRVGGISDKLKDILNDLDGIQVPSISASGNLAEYHNGGISGDTQSSPATKLANRIFNSKPNETVIKTLLGELHIPSRNIENNFIPAMQMMANKISDYVLNRQSPSSSVISQDTNYEIANVTVVANNPMEMFRGLSSIIQANKK